MLPTYGRNFLTTKVRPDPDLYGKLKIVFLIILFSKIVIVIRAVEIFIFLRYQCGLEVLEFSLLLIELKVIHSKDLP